MDDINNSVISLNPKRLQQAKKLLADFLGVSEEDINPDDDIKNDLHMGATQIADFMEILEENGFPNSSVDLKSIETLNDLFEQIIEEEL